MSATEAKPLPNPTDLSRPFWDACKRHELTSQRCASCGQYVFTPQDYCRYCFADALEWTPVSGKGTIYSYTVIWRPQTPAFEVPYVVAIIDMEEGYQMMSNIVECPWEDVKVGMALEVVFDDASADISLPKFRPRT